MLDKSVPNYPVFMTRNDIYGYKEFPLPEGLTFHQYKTGMAIEWVRLQMYYQQYETFGEGLSYFKKVYIEQGNMIYDRLIFVRDENDLVVATGALWVGTHFGNVMHKISGVAVHPDFRHKGIAMAVVTQLLQIANELECKGGLYCNMCTWNYPFINMMFKHGFVAYMGKKPKNHAMTDTEYSENNRMAWEVIMNKIGEYNKKHVDEQNAKWGAL